MFPLVKRIQSRFYSEKTGSQSTNQSFSTHRPRVHKPGNDSQDAMWIPFYETVTNSIAESRGVHTLLYRKCRHQLLLDLNGRPCRQVCLSLSSTFGAVQEAYTSSMNNVEARMAQGM